MIITFLRTRLYEKNLRLPLKKNLEGISQKVLTDSLRSMEEWEISYKNMNFFEKSASSSAGGSGEKVLQKVRQNAPLISKEE